MKAYLLTYALIVSQFSGRFALGQSTFAFSNYNPGAGIDAPVFDAAGTKLSGSFYLAELYGGATPSSLAPAVLYDFGALGPRLALPFFTGGDAGYFFTSKSLAVPEVPGYGFAWLQVRTWDAKLGGTYEEAAAKGSGGYGESNLIFVRGAGPGTPPPLPSSLVGLRSFSLRPVPEPGTVVLLLLGAPLLFCRRRKPL